jgi:hypothetical protein
MDAGELGTFLGGKTLFIEVDDHPDLSTSNTSSMCGAVDDYFKELTSEMGSEDDVCTPAHQLSTGGGSLSHASFGALGGDITGSDDESNRVANKRKRSDNDLSALGFEVESPASLVESAMRISSPVAEPLAHFFPPPPVHLNATEGSDGGTRYFTAGMGTPLLPPPPNSNGVALGLPINPEIHHLRKQPTLLRSTTSNSSSWGCAVAPPQLSVQYCKSAFGAPRISPLSGDLTAALNDVLRGKTTTPPLGLKLNIAAVVSELKAAKLA